MNDGGPDSMERDFTAPHGRVAGHRSFTGSTGDAALDGRLAAFATSVPGVGDGPLLLEMLTTALRIGRMDISAGEFKLLNRVLRELRHAEEVFRPWRNIRKVAVFGSARTAPDDPEYKAAVQFSRRMRDAGFMTITGAGPGIMAAGNEGAGRGHSFGLNILLPFETGANEFIAGDEKVVPFNYFFTRKLTFVKESHALAGFPGGFGTMDEVFEALTLIQTGKSTVHPIVLVDAPGGTYWKFWNRFLQEHLLRLGLISGDDFALYKVTDDIGEAVDEIVRFYRVFHSYRYVGDKLVMRLLKPLASDEVARLGSEFSDLVKSGAMVQRGVLEAEGETSAADGLPRLVFRHQRGNYGRLRLLIDAVNLARTE